MVITIYSLLDELTGHITITISYPTMTVIETSTD